ncbi:hypothetical protein [Streptomyces sp. KLOTTS4A1]|uniref:hypothetical protein n=1 Tax=Streptomyces sp. KLOTTS4A1 TaxID=3390996 RepID=UPI0039F5C308
MRSVLSRLGRPSRRATVLVAAIAGLYALPAGVHVTDARPAGAVPLLPPSAVAHPDDAKPGEGPKPADTRDGRRPPSPRITLDKRRHQLVLRPGGTGAVAAYRYRIGEQGRTHQVGSDPAMQLHVAVPAGLDDTVEHPVTVEAQSEDGRWSAPVTRKFTFLHRNPAGGDYRVMRLAAEDMAAGKDAAPGTFEFTVPTAATYRLVVKQLTDAGHGRVSYTLDGRRIGPVVDGYAPKPGARAVTLGTQVLKAGRHRLVAKTEGKNPAAEGKAAGLDYLELTPLLMHEAEDLIAADRSKGPAARREADSGGVRWSGGAQAALAATRPGERFTLAFEVARPAWYALGTQQTVGPDYGAVTFALDGIALDQRYDAGRPKAATEAVGLGIHHLRKGRHILTFTAAPGAGSKEALRIGVDLLKVVPLSGSYEAELTTSRAKGRTSVQHNCCSAAYSGGHQRLLGRGGPGDTVEFTFAADLDGAYSLNATMSRQPGFGTVRFAVDGKPVEQPFNGHSPRSTTQAVHLGTYEFTEGLHTLTVMVEDSPMGERSGAGVDRIDIYPEGEGL